MDWERARGDGLPGHDLVFYLQYVAESRAGAFTREQQVEAHDDVFGERGWGVGIARAALDRVGVDPDLLDLLVLASWARSAATLAERIAPGSPQADVDATVRADRDVRLWRHVVERAEQRSQSQGGPSRR
jgi:hypothetical protein